MLGREARLDVKMMAKDDRDKKNKNKKKLTFSTFIPGNY